MMIGKVETELAAISQQLKSSTVEIQERRSGGSGVIWTKDGLIVTNSHVVNNSQVRVKLESGRVVRGSLIARDRSRDLAAVKINLERSDSPETPALGDKRLLRPGEIVLAMGSPWGFSGALTVGTIHALPSTEQNIATPYESERLATAIVADIRLAPGNSGGLLANARGEVVGINAAIYRGLALAIPVRQVIDFVAAIAR